MKQQPATATLNNQVNFLLLSHVASVCVQYLKHYIRN